MAGHKNWREMFEKVEFYRVDIRLLEELGHKVILAPRIQDIDWGADLFYCWWWGYSVIPVAASLATRKPCVVTGAFDYASCRDELPGFCYLDRPLWKKKIINFVLNYASASLFVSRYEFDEVVSNLRIKNPVLVPHAIDTDFYSPQPHEPFKSDYFFSVSWTSRTNVIRKGVIQTIEAFSRIASDFPHARLVIAGKPGDYESSLRDLARGLGVARRVEFLGMISDEEKLEHYRRCIAYVQPTLYEGFGLAIAEAVACGCPVITSSRGAVPEVVGGFGKCVEPHDIDAIAAEMRARMQEQRIYEDELASHAWIREKYSLDARRECLSRVLSQVIRTD